MTTAVLCDGCGRIVSERSTEPDPYRSWWTLGPFLGFDLIEIEDLEELDVDDDGEIVTPPPEPCPTTEAPLHFCSRDCLRTWVVESEPPPPELPA